ncbi:hypothetical protein PT286_02470, partial [Neisseriaceae bacterium ESL0693]|nr:hypothetical protein [Neisseriaceae bacterium ESL0693]
NALKSLGKNYDRIMVDPATGRVLPTTANASALWDFSHDVQETVAAVDKDYANNKPWTQEQFNQQVMSQIEQRFDETMKNLNEIRKLLEEQKKAAAAANDKGALQKTGQLLNQVDDNMNKLQQAMTESQALSGVDNAAAIIPAGVLPQRSLSLPVVENPLPGTQLPAGMELSIENVRLHIQEQLSALSPLTAQAEGTADGLAAIDTTKRQITQAALQELGIESEMNEYLSGRLLEESQPQLRLLAEELSAGKTPEALQTLSPMKLQRVRQLLQQYLQVSQS